MFESIGWKPTAGLGGFLGGNAYAQDITRGLQDLVQSKEKHDLGMLSDRLNYDIRRADEDQLGELKRNFTKQELGEKATRLPLETELLANQSNQIKTQTELAKSQEKRVLDEEQRKKISDRMYAVESAYHQLVSTMGPEMNVTDLVPHLRSNLMKTLVDGGWEEKDIPQENEALRAWIIQGRQRAIYDRPRLEAGLRHYYARDLQETRNQGTLDAAQARLQSALGKFDPVKRMGELARKAASQNGTLSPEEMAEYELYASLAELKAKETAQARLTGTFQGLQQIQGGNIQPSTPPLPRPTPQAQSKPQPTAQPKPTAAPNSVEEIKKTYPNYNKKLDLKVLQAAVETLNNPNAPESKKNLAKKALGLTE